MHFNVPTFCLPHSCPLYSYISPVPLIFLLPPLAHGRRANRAAPAAGGSCPPLADVGEVVPKLAPRLVERGGALPAARALAIDEAHEVLIGAAGAFLGLAGDGRCMELGLLAEVGLGELVEEGVYVSFIPRSVVTSGL